jgi:hypothetical protein
MRLSILSPQALKDEQKALYDDIRDGDRIALRWLREPSLRRSADGSMTPMAA